MTVTFYKNNTIKMKASYDYGWGSPEESITWSDWKIEDGKLCGKSQSPGSEYECSEYKFSNDNKELSITQNNVKMILVKS